MSRPGPAEAGEQRPCACMLRGWWTHRRAVPGYRRPAGPVAIALVLTTGAVVVRIGFTAMLDAQPDMTVVGAAQKFHVSSVLLKLGLRDRVQAVILAYGSGLLSPATTRPTS